MPDSKPETTRQTFRGFTHGLGERLKVTHAKTSSKTSTTKEVDVALIKATTSRFHVVPKEKHVITLKQAASEPRGRGPYVATETLRRLRSPSDWLTKLKTLITIHRLLREASEQPSFWEEIIRVGDSSGKGRTGRVLAVDNFIDTVSGDGRYDFSEWVRAYGRYLDEQLEVFHSTKWRIEDEPSSGTESRLKDMPVRDLLHVMPALQRLQRRLCDCVPHGRAVMDGVVFYSLTLVVRESFRLHKALSQGLINLADVFFGLDYTDALHGLDIYKDAIIGSETLAGYYASLQASNLHLDLPKLQHPPADFVSSMENYVDEAPNNPKDGSSKSGESHSTAHRPLRKGRLLQQMHPEKDGQTTRLDEQKKMVDPGMLLPLTRADDHNTDAEAHDDVTQASPSGQDAVTKAPAAASNFDFLTFDEEQQTNDRSRDEVEEHVDGITKPSDAQQNVAGIASEQKKELTPLDLLAELDFGGLSVETAGQPQSAGQDPLSFFASNTGSVEQKPSASFEAFLPSYSAPYTQQPVALPQSAYPAGGPTAILSNGSWLTQPSQKPTIAVPQPFSSPTIDSSSTPSTVGALGWATVSSPPGWHQEQQRIKEAGAMDHFADLSAGVHPRLSASSPSRPTSARPSTTTNASM